MFRWNYRAYFGAIAVIALIQIGIHFMSTETYLKLPKVLQFKPWTLDGEQELIIAKEQLAQEKELKVSRSEWIKDTESKHFMLKVKPIKAHIAPKHAVNSSIKAAFVILTRNSDLHDIRATMQQMEDRFNHNYHYPYVFLNDKPFTTKFKKFVQAITTAEVHFGKIPKEHWGYPEWIDKDKAREARETMQEKKIIYGGSESYRHMCRFYSGFFYRHPLLQNFDYYWRVEPGVKYFCDIDYDVFQFMKDNNIKYGWNIAPHEYSETIPTLWDEVKKFSKKHSNLVHKNNLMEFISDDEGDSFNGCHFWSNFEIGDLNFWRSKAYSLFFDHLDKSGGFFYERWGDAPVHSIAASLLLDRKQVHFFQDIGYYHPGFTYCPQDEKTQLKCSCDPKKDQALHSDYFCNNRYLGLES